MLKNHKLFLYLAITFSLIFTLACSSNSTNTSSAGTSTSVAQQGSLASQPTAAQSVTVNLPGFSNLLKVVENAVVKIDVASATTNFFGQTVPLQGAGSGWILSSDGSIVTANHVVEGATSITVTTLDGKTFPAQVVNGDSTVDVALLKINASGLPVLNIGDTSKIQSGDWVLAIGNPLGEGIIATQGIISRLGVSVQVSASQTFTNMIETTAAINPGNSGGPLINLNGEVIGITSLKVSASGIEGMGYAINMQNALPVIQK
jgi:serine protease Do